MLVPYSSARVATDVPASVLGYIRERPELFEGVTVEQTYLRDYPRDGWRRRSSAPSARSTPTSSSRSASAGSARGRSSARAASSARTTSTCAARTAAAACRSTPTAARSPTRRLKDTKPVSGQRVRLSLDLALQQAGQDAIAGPLNPGSNPGAFVAIDPRQGEVLAMGSHPTFDPSIFTKPLTEARYKALLGTNAQAGPAVQPRDQRWLSDGVDVQADHRAGRPRQRPDRGGHDDRRPRLHQGRRDRPLQRQGAGLRRGQPHEGAAGLLRRLLLQARHVRVLPRRVHHPEVVAQARPRPRRPASTCRARSPA